jgi:Leucine-rich repeat (LRR) protein
VPVELEQPSKAGGGARAADLPEVPVSTATVGEVSAMLKRLGCRCSCWSSKNVSNDEEIDLNADGTRSDPHQLDLSQRNLNQLSGRMLRGNSCRRSLHALMLSNNQLEQVPGRVFRCRALKRLDLAQNQLNSLPSSLHKLKDLQWLGASGNNIQQLSASFSQLKQLKHLDLSNNPPLLNLPPDIGECEPLEFVSVSHTCVNLLPDSFEKYVLIRKENR